MDPLTQRTIDIDGKKQTLEIDSSNVIRSKIQGQSFYRWGQDGKPRKTFNEAIRDGFLKLMMDEFGLWGDDWDQLMDDLSDQWGEDFSSGFTWQEDDADHDWGDHGGGDDDDGDTQEVAPLPDWMGEIHGVGKDPINIQDYAPAVPDDKKEKGDKELVPASAESPNLPNQIGSELSGYRPPTQQGSESDLKSPPPPNDMDLTVNGIPVGRITAEKDEDDLVEGELGRKGWRASGSKYGTPTSIGGSKFSGFRNVSETQHLQNIQQAQQKKKS